MTWSDITSYHLLCWFAWGLLSAVVCLILEASTSGRIRIKDVLMATYAFVLGPIVLVLLTVFMIMEAIGLIGKNWDKIMQYEIWKHNEENDEH